MFLDGVGDVFKRGKVGCGEFGCGSGEEVGARERRRFGCLFEGEGFCCFDGLSGGGGEVHFDGDGGKGSCVGRWQVGDRKGEEEEEVDGKGEGKAEDEVGGEAPFFGEEWVYCAHRAELSW